MITEETLIEGIRKDLGLDDQVLDESYVALAKNYDLNTELLSTKAKAAHEELYKAYVDNLNRANAELDAADKKDDLREYQDTKKREVFNLNAVHLHELFFANISDVYSEITMDTLTFMRLERDFGTFDRWQYDFVANALTPKNGWAVCGFSTFLQRYINVFIDGHSNCIPAGFYPVIVVDVWEHAYFRDYMTDRKSYVYAMMKELQWDVIEERFKRADKIAEALR